MSLLWIELHKNALLWAMWAANSCCLFTALFNILLYLNASRHCFLNMFHFIHNAFMFSTLLSPAVPVFYFLFTFVYIYLQQLNKRYTTFYISWQWMSSTNTFQDKTVLNSKQQQQQQKLLKVHGMLQCRLNAKS